MKIFTSSSNGSLELRIKYAHDVYIPGDTVHCQLILDLPPAAVVSKVTAEIKCIETSNLESSEPWSVPAFSERKTLPEAAIDDLNRNQCCHREIPMNLTLSAYSNEMPPTFQVDGAGEHSTGVRWEVNAVAEWHRNKIGSKSARETKYRVLKDSKHIIFHPISDGQLQLPECWAALNALKSRQGKLITKDFVMSIQIPQLLPQSPEGFEATIEIEPLVTSFVGSVKVILLREVTVCSRKWYRVLPRESEVGRMDYNKEILKGSSIKFVLQCELEAREPSSFSGALISVRHRLLFRVMLNHAPVGTDRLIKIESPSCAETEKRMADGTNSLLCCNSPPSYSEK